MTVTGLILLKFFYREGGARGETMSKAFQYGTLGLLFVNISIGGTLTPFAAPPVLIVAEKYGWDVTFMFSSFGYKRPFLSSWEHSSRHFFLGENLRENSWKKAMGRVEKELPSGYSSSTSFSSLW